MQQQINLYRFVKRPVKSYLTTKIVLAGIGGFFAVLMTYYFAMLVYQHHLYTQTVQLNKELDTVRIQLAQVAAKYPHSNYADDLIKLPPCDIRFSRYLMGFAKAEKSGIWLTEIEISNGGDRVTLHGHALKAEEVQLYIDSLKALPLFGEFKFEVSELSEVTEAANQNGIANSVLTFLITASGAGKHG